MTLQEALKSGKKIKRSIHTLFSTPSTYYSPEEVLATDWETEVEQVLLTEAQVIEALYNEAIANPSIKNVLKRLGFTEM